MSIGVSMPEGQTIAFDEFWSWLQRHPHCIVRAGSGDVVMFDHDDHHWHFGVDPEGGSLYVQCVRGKRPVAEMNLHIQDVAYVLSHPEEDDEWFFDLHDQEHHVLYYFVLSHRYDAGESGAASHLN